MLYFNIDSTIKKILLGSMSDNFQVSFNATICPYGHSSTTPKLAIEDARIAPPSPTPNGKFINYLHVFAKLM